MRYAYGISRMPKRVDNNHTYIVRMLREFGAHVWDSHECGKGSPDIWVSYRWKIYPMEIKSEGGKLTPAEEEWRDKWQGPYFVVHSIEEALQILCNGEED
jgi:hypothetical protein